MTQGTAHCAYARCTTDCKRFCRKKHHNTTNLLYYRRNRKQ